MKRRLREIVDYSEFFRYLVYQQLEQRYNSSVLGFIWTLLFPLLTFASLAIVFSTLNRWDLRDFGVYFFSGYLGWLFFTNSCMMAAESVVGNPVYVTRLRMPRILLPLSSVTVNLIDLFATVAVLFILMLIWDVPFSGSLLFLPISAAIMVVFVTGASLLCAVANVFMRDFRYLLSSAFFLWFFFSPILWKPEILTGSNRAIMDWNPVVPFLLLFQLPIWAGRVPEAATVILSAGAAVALLLGGAAVFWRCERNFYYYL